MKILCQTRSLQNSMQLVAGVVPSNPTRPVLQCVHLVAQDAGQGLLVQGTDLDQGISVRIDEVQVETPGSAIVPAVRMHGILRELTTEQLELELEEAGKTLVVRAGKSLFKVPVEFVEEFPRLDFELPNPALRISRDLLLRALRLTAVAAARDATRFQMHSVLIDCRPDLVRFVSTDGKRMAITDIEGASVSEEAAGKQYIVPLKGVDLLGRILGADDEGDEVELHLDPSQVTYCSDRVSLFCRLVEGRFPDYDRAVPPSGGSLYELPCPDLLTALRQAALMTTKETHSVLFTFDGTDLVLSTKASNVGESRVELQITPVDANIDQLAVNFNPTYLMDLLKVADLQTVHGQFRDHRTAGIFSFEENGMKYRHFVMPLVTHD